ncbi:MAG: hypothetical protein E6K77_02380 [Candidatus Eisenbacteria bacterium]|uniref:DinB family protein n=1 Tax=Eiseniibacteriota bacterium TaxID=2212470 RepID=A0A538TQ39_UNCEI|nr:MAG: hypothetical protein E6K77_02380 [Candidatus Eisenbacteria bacterium]
MSSPVFDPSWAPWKRRPAFESERSDRHDHRGTEALVPVQPVLELLGEQPVWSASDGELYKRGSTPIAGGATAKPFPAIFQALDQSQERLLAGLSRMQDSDLGSADTKGSLAAKLAGLQFHEAYHAGQLGLLRRIAGKKGAIQ